MSKVYVVNNSGHDFSSAKKFGELIYLSEGRMNRFKINHMYRLFVDKMKDSESNDFILMSGLSQMNMVASSIFAFKHGKLNILIFSERDNDYTPREIVLSNLLKK